MLKSGANEGAMATIYDVAELAGVSAKTVSRVANDDSAVKEATREKVLAAMATLDYRPNAQARGLRLGTSRSVGLLLEDPSSGYQGRFHSAMLTACMEENRYLAVELFSANMSDWQPYLDRFVIGSQIRDMILLPTLCDWVPLKDMLKVRGIRCVLISPTTPDDVYSTVAMDDARAARDVIDYLLAQGHRRIAHISGHPDHMATRLRLEGVRAAFDAAGLPRPSADYVPAGNFGFRSGFEATERLLTLPEPPTAIFAANDEMAAAACSAAHKIGLKIPDDIAIIGFDDAPISSAVWPALTTVRQPYLDMARRSIQLLSNGETGGRHIIPHEIVARDTTKPM